MKISHLISNVIALLILLSGGGVIYGILVQAYNWLIVSLILFSILSIILIYPALKKMLPHSIQEVCDIIAGVFKEPFAVAFVLGEMIFQGIFGKVDEPFDQEGNPILLSNGYLGTSGQLIYLKQQLKKNNAGAIFTMDYAYPLASIDTFANEMKRKVEEIQTYYPGKKITIIGYSMGGIIASRYAANCENIDHLHKIITLGSPLQGTYFAHLTFGKCAKEMRRGSPYLSRLERDLSSKNIPFINVTSSSDLIVLPNSSASFKYVPSKKVRFGSMGHMTYLCSDRLVSFLIPSVFN